ncbi:MAG: hypothetical protein WDN46_12710 [Methylocella sp.]
MTFSPVCTSPNLWALGHQSRLPVGFGPIVFGFILGVARVRVDFPAFFNGLDGEYFDTNLALNAEV